MWSSPILHRTTTTTPPSPLRGLSFNPSFHGAATKPQGNSTSRSVLSTVGGGGGLVCPTPPPGQQSAQSSTPAIRAVVCVCVWGGELCPPLPSPSPEEGRLAQFRRGIAQGYGFPRTRASSDGLLSRGLLDPKAHVFVQHHLWVRLSIARLGGWGGWVRPRHRAFPAQAGRGGGSNKWGARRLGGIP